MGILNKQIEACTTIKTFIYEYLTTIKNTYEKLKDRKRRKKILLKLYELYDIGDLKATINYQGCRTELATVLV